MDQLRTFRAIDDKLNGSLRQLGRLLVEKNRMESEIVIQLPLSGLGADVMDGNLSRADAIAHLAPAPMRALIRRAEVYEAAAGMMTVLSNVTGDPSFRDLARFDQPFEETVILILPMDKMDLSMAFDASEDGDPAILHFFLKDGDLYGHGMMTAKGIVRLTRLKRPREHKDAQISADIIWAWWLLACNDLVGSTEYKEIISKKRTHRGKKVLPMKSVYVDYGFFDTPFPLSAVNYIQDEKGRTVMTALTSWQVDVNSVVSRNVVFHANAIDIPCSSCGEKEEYKFNGSRLPPDALVKKLQNKGWTGLGKNPVCPTCNAKKKEAPVAQSPKLTLVGDDMQNASPDAKKQHRKIMEALFSVFDDETHRYNSGYSDQRVADETGAPVNAVKKCREDYFGPLAVPAEAEELRNMLATAQRTLDNFKAATEDKIAGLETEIGKLKAHYENVSRAHGWTA